MACSYDAAYTGELASPNCTIAHSGDYIGILNGYSATTGYDEATGLGSLNVSNLVNAWTASTGLATPTVAITPQSSTTNAADTFDVTVSVSGAAGVPSGTITLSGAGSSSITETIGTSPCTSATSCVFIIPAGTFTTAGPVTLTATYNGDAQYTAGSAQTHVTVSTAALLTPTVTVTPPSSSATPETGRASSPTWRQASMPARQVRSALAGPSPAFPRLSVLAVPAPAPCPLSRL